MLEYPGINIGYSGMVIGKMEPMDNLTQQSCTVKCRKVIINVLSVETSSHLNVETEGLSGVVIGKLNQWKICA